jgi:hypothetical protein
VCVPRRRHSSPVQVTVGTQRLDASGEVWRQPVQQRNRGLDARSIRRVNPELVLDAFVAHESIDHSEVATARSP